MNDAPVDLTQRADSQAQRAALRSAVQAKGLKRFAFFGTSIEGRVYPDGIEERSGFVLNEDGRVWSFWTGWDDAAQRPIIDEWTEEAITPNLKRGHEYAKARQHFGFD